MTNASPEKEVAVHDLFSREIRPLCNWKEWLDRWQAAIAIEEMFGLLHCGFDVDLTRYRGDDKEYDATDRLMFYFNIADGWAQPYRLLSSPAKDDRTFSYNFGRDEHGNPLRHSAADLRGILAKKAFDMLCLNFFKASLQVTSDKNGSKDVVGYWSCRIATERLMPEMTKFFRLEENAFGQMAIANLSRGRHESNNEKQAVDFLLKFASFLWEWKEEEIETYTQNKPEVMKGNAAMRNRIETAKPWMVEVLDDLGKLEILARWMFELDDACLNKLKEIALRSKIDCHSGLVKEDRFVLTLDEACYTGSRAAWFLKRREIMQREKGRLAAIAQAESARTEAEEEIKKLTIGS